jgi:hypothetical protein
MTQQYRLIGHEGIATYLMQAGKDIVKAQMSMETAERIVMSGNVQNKALPMHPTYCVNIGPLYFKGTWKKRRMKDVVCE